MLDHAENPGSPVEERASVFISYRHSDRGAADRLYELLRERDVSAWYDPLIPASTDWREAIVEHLSAARVMVVLLSSAALESDDLRKELAVAVQEGVQLLPVRLEDIKPPGAFAYELARSNWFDVFDDPPTRFAALADLLAEIAKTPREADLDPILQAWQRRWNRLTGQRVGRWTGNNSRLGMLFIAVSAVVFLLYESRVEPLKELERSGFAPATAFFAVVLATTIGSPLILFSILRGGVEVQDLPLLAAAAVNTVILVLLIRNLFSWIRLLLLNREAP